MKPRIHALVSITAALTCANAFASCGGSCTGGVSFTPTSVKMPIWSMTLSSSSGGASGSLYHCSGSSDADCYVDVAQPSQLSALAAKASGATVPAGTYDTIDISYCQNASGSAPYTYLMEGSVSLGGTTYYTASSANGYLSTSSANEAYVSVSTPGCSQEYKFTTPVTVSAGSTASLSLFTTVVNMAWATNALTTYSTYGGQYVGYNTQGCSTSGSNAVCSNTALVIPYFGTGTPTVQYYTFTDTGSGSGGGVGAQLMTLLDPTGTLIGAFPARVFSSVTSGAENFGEGGGFDAQIQSVSKNSDGSYVVTNGSQSNTSNGFYFGNFKLLSAVNDTATGESGTLLGGTVTYTETRTK